MKIKDKVKPTLPPVQPGVYVAVCIGVADLGEQYSEYYKSYSNKVRIIWELPGETCTVDGVEQPRQLSREFTMSKRKNSKLRSFLSSWAGKAYTDEEFGELDLNDLVGKPGQLNVVLNDTGEYANVDTILALPKGMAAPTTETKPILWDMAHWDDAAFQALPEWLQGQIKKSTQYQKEHAPTDTITLEKRAEEECSI